MKTGFLQGFANLTLNWIYDYHGITEICYRQAERKALYLYPIDVPYGPELFKSFIGLGFVGWLYSKKWDYWFARNSPVGSTYAPFVGQSYTGYDKVYRVMRVGVGFNTSSLPDNAKITRATLYMTKEYDLSYKDFDIVLKNGMPTYPHLPNQLIDYAFTNYSGNGGSVNTSSINWNIFELNESGLGWINVFGITKFALIGSRDTSGIIPTGDEYVCYNLNLGMISLDVYYKTPL